MRIDTAPGHPPFLNNPAMDNETLKWARTYGRSYAQKVWLEGWLGSLRSLQAATPLTSLAQVTPPRKPAFVVLDEAPGGASALERMGELLRQQSGWSDWERLPAALDGADLYAEIRLRDTAMSTFALAAANCGMTYSAD